jgi:rubrerythrin
MDNHETEKTTENSNNLTKWKIFPRNLTAKADYIVKGNPANTRPESGVDNCYPGLEFDQRNLDKFFFPGLVFEYHRNDGAVVHKILNGLPREIRLTDDDLLDSSNRPILHLLAMIGRTSYKQNESDPPLFNFGGLNGLEVWRRVHDLIPGRILIVLGRDFDAIPGARTLEETRDSNNSTIQRDEDGNISLAILVADRATYLDENGTLDIESYQPGELTRSLCAPWQYDFRDCGCFYWAASKPDLVSSSDGKLPYLNFQRKDRSEFPPADTPTMNGRREQELDYSDLINEEWWNKLPVVLNDRESEEFIPPLPAESELMTRERVISELQYLATVEHALLVEYLYAHYSLNAPMTLSEQDGTNQQTKRIFAAAKEIFSIAVDEMRHLRWVNEALDLLGESPSIDRTDRIGRQFKRKFELKPLTPEQLQWFIDVEEPSQSINEGIDGMYVRLHTSIVRQPKIFPEHDRLVTLIKLIIDEGENHYERFKSIQEHLKGIDPPIYLRTLSDPIPNSRFLKLQELSDANYAVVIASLVETFSLGDKASGILIKQSVRAMQNLHEINHLLASNGVHIKFTKPPLPPLLPLTFTAAHDYANSVKSTYDKAVSLVKSSENQNEVSLALKHEKSIDNLFQLMHNLIDEDKEPE